MSSRISWKKPWDLCWVGWKGLKPRNWDSPGGIWSCVPEHQDPDEIGNREYSGNVVRWLKEWIRCWFICSCANFTHPFLLQQVHILFNRLVLFWHFCATAVSVASDDTVFNVSPLCWPMLEMEAVAYSCDVSIAISKVQRIAVKSIWGTWSAFLAEEQTWLHMDLPIDSTSVSCLYPSSLSHLEFP